MSECIAHAMGWISTDEAMERLLLSARSFAGHTPGFAPNRNANGWMPSFFDSDTGHATPSKYATLATGLNAAGLLLAKTYVSQTSPQHPAVPQIQKYVDEAVDKVRWETLLCNEKKQIDPKGRGIPMTYDAADGSCGGVGYPEADGWYQFYENHYTVWITYMRCAAAGAAAGASGCQDEAIQAMWDRWQGRALHPNWSYEGHPLLSLWSCYLVHLPFYNVRAFNNNSNFQALFKSHWEADRAYYRSSYFYAGEQGMYGMGAGTTQKWCAGTDYIADRIKVNVTGGQGCRDYSTYCLPGYLPADPERVTSDILALLASGEAVLRVPASLQRETGFEAVPGDQDGYVLARSSLLSPGWTQASRLTMADFGSELMGLSTLWLGTEWFQRMTDHWPDVRQ